jgi:hypothetical protein
MGTIIHVSRGFLGTWSCVLRPIEHPANAKESP